MTIPTETPNKWIPRPAVRAWLYGIAIAVGALLVGYGALTAEQGGLWLALVGAILGGTNAVATKNLPRR